MFIMDVPDMPRQYASVMVAQANQAQIASVTKERAIGNCRPVRYNSYEENYGSAQLSPEVTAADYFYLYEKRVITNPAKTGIELISGPKHGRIEYSTERDGTLRQDYIPDSGYLGSDKLVYRVKIDGTTVRVVYILKVTKLGIDSGEAEQSLCKQIGLRWKISSAADLPTPSLAFADLPNDELRTRRAQ